MKRRLILILFFCLIFITNSGFLVIGHRGDPTKYPEETIQSDNSAFNSGADYVELDVHLSKDNVLVISHDDDLSRMTYTPSIVSQNNFATLSKLTYPNGEHVMSLDQLFAYYQNKPQAKFLIETKVDHGVDKSDKLEKILSNSIKKYHMEKRVMIHSFSGKSLTYLSTLLPSVPRLLIVGSMKRINFEILQDITGVNVSSDLVKKYPFLVKWMHGTDRKIFVWAEMDERPQLWNWLINNNVDGVVTNYPATGFKYKVAKSGSKQTVVNRDGYYLQSSPTIATMNPYADVPTKTKIHDFESVHISSAVAVAGKIYYQVGDHAFIPAATVSLDLTPIQVLPYKNLTLTVPDGAQVPTYTEPSNANQTNKSLKINTQYKIIGYNGSLKSLWFKTNSGWVKANEVLLNGLEPGTIQYWYYQKLPEHDSFIRLLPNSPLLPIINHNWQTNYHNTWKIINNKAL